MDISVTVFKQHCLDIIRRVEERGEPVTITRRGKIVARLAPAPGGPKGGGKPWERLQAMGGRCDFAAEESVLREKDLKALR
jgi:prevent-host-death family protein